jgi:hypothetical protein
VSELTISESIIEALSPQSLARVRAVKAEARGKLVLMLSDHWLSAAPTMELMHRHEPDELVPLFMRYAESQYDGYAEELLPSAHDVDEYSAFLSLVTVAISTEILPSEPIHPPRLTDTNWVWLLERIQASEPAIRNPALTIAIDILNGANGDWERSVGESLTNQWKKGGYAGLKRINLHNIKAKQFLDFALRLRYQFHLRLFVNFYRFDNVLEAYLAPRLAYWEAKAYRRHADHPDPSPEKSKKPTAEILLEYKLSNKIRTHEKVAETLGLERSVYFDLKAGRKVSEETRHKAAQKIGCSPDLLKP